jgi:hypothetical protein
MIRNQIACALLVFAASCATVSGPRQPQVSPADLTVLEGDGWTGKLFYRDYSPPFSETSIRAELESVRIAENGVRFAMIYPDEGNTKSNEAISVSEDGRMIGSDPLIAREMVDGRLILVTAEPCEDDDRPAFCEKTYTISADYFAMQKDVSLENGEAPFIRNRYEFTR